MLVLLQRIITERTNCRVRATHNSLEVPKLLEAQDFDLVIADLKMPGLDGLEILNLIQRLKKPVEVVIITAYGSIETAVEAMRKGAYDYITKPFKKDQILQTIDRVMRWQKARKEVAQLRQAMGAFEVPYAEGMRLFRKEYYKQCLEKAGGDAQKAAREAGLDRAEFERLSRDD